MKRSITLRDSRNPASHRHMVASLSADGVLTIEGQDQGQDVEQIFGAGNREYEWVWTIQSKDVLRLALTLDAGDDVLMALAACFSDDAASGLKSFLDEQEIPHECWSRIGD